MTTVIKNKNQDLITKNIMQLINKDCFDYLNWINLLKKVCIESEYVVIPEFVQEYILDEMIILPKECNTANNEEEWLNEIEDDSEKTEEPEFPEFSSKVQNIIDRLGKSCFIKTNHSSPKDAFWITTGQTLKVRDLTDFYQLIKASSLVKEDLKSTISKQNGNNSCVVVFKKWLEIHPGSEFRCFVKDKSLIAISPRDWPQFHHHFQSQRVDIVNDITSLFKENVKAIFPSKNCKLFYRFFKIIYFST